MLTRFNDWLLARSSGRNVLLTLAAFLVMFGIFGLVLGPAFQAASGGLRPIDMSPDKSVDAMYAQFAHYTDASRVVYRWFFLLDFIYPPTLALLFATLWAWLARRTRWQFPQRWIGRGLLLVPFVAAILDWTENVGFLALIEALPAQHRGLAFFTGTTNYVKLAILAACMLTTLLFAIGALARRRK
jgi:hypothetical protein